MPARRALVLPLLLALLLTGCAAAPATPAASVQGAIFAIVDGVEIPVSRVDQALAVDEVIYACNREWIQDADFLTEEERAEQLALLALPTREEAEQDLIRNEVLRACAREAGIDVSIEEARARLAETYAVQEALLAQDEATALWTQDMQNRLAAALGMSWAEYEEQCMLPSLQWEMALERLSEQVGALHWEAYVESALAEAEIVYP